MLTLVCIIQEKKRKHYSYFRYWSFLCTHLDPSATYIPVVTGADKQRLPLGMWPQVTCVTAPVALRL